MWSHYWLANFALVPRHRDEYDDDDIETIETNVESRDENAPTLYRIPNEISPPTTHLYDDDDSRDN